MKQVFQSLKSGKTEILSLPKPGAPAWQLLVRSHVSLVSAGTERMLVEFGKANWLDKARQQPEKVRTAHDLTNTRVRASITCAVRLYSLIAVPGKRPRGGEQVVQIRIPNGLVEMLD